MIASKVVVWFTVLALLPICGSAQDLSQEYAGYFGPGDEWVYDVTSIYEDMEMSGTMRYWYDGISTDPISSHSSRMYVIRMESYLDVSGSYGGGLLAGHSSLEMTMYIDCETLDTVCCDSSETTYLDISFLMSGIYDSMEYTVTNLTVYAPPGGTGEEPAYLEVGAAWTKNYTMQSEVVEVVDGSMDTYSVTYSELVNYEVLRIESISVPAGDFDCYAIGAEGLDVTQISWVSEAVKFEVKIDTYYPTYGGTYCVLTYYKESLGGTSESPVSHLAAGAIVAVVAAAVVVLIVTRRKPRTPTEVPVPQQAFQSSSPSDGPCFRRFLRICGQPLGRSRSG